MGAGNTPKEQTGNKKLLKGIVIGVVGTIGIVLLLSPLAFWGAREMARSKMANRMDEELAKHKRKLHEVNPQQYRAEKEPVFVDDLAVHGK